ncbi:related to purple acid phosphatase [Ramularia collo-cygni]|uniref:Related to purple acid phosphatase n=1 Tax=Ramularia collo-cygni TaxID=112498 RepID=A0A2D3UQ23_9PEZI|nr:related to purple acid phosphatase [Ramularia collo-cygni]CZT18822.1 related to purple acid phosphatase [Ramularia collo-cygni]
MSVVIDLGVYGENGYNTTKRDTIHDIQPELNHTTIGALARTADQYEFVLHPGDLAYADQWGDRPSNAHDGKNAFEAILETFYNQLSPISRRKPYMVSPGNHEANCQDKVPAKNYSCPEGQSNFTDFMNRFGRTVPTAFLSTSQSTAAQSQALKAASLAVPPFWYSFEYGMAHIVMINTETDYPGATDGPKSFYNAGNFSAPNQQLAFLEADLASVDRSVTPWVILGGHRPWYSSVGDRCRPCQEAFEELMYKYGVDVAIFGHVHNAQRFDPMYRNATDPRGLNDPKAPMYLIMGGAGNIEPLAALPPGENATGMVFAYADGYSYGNVKFLDRNRLGVDFIRSSTGEVLDSSELYKNHSVDFVLQE